MALADASCCTRSTPIQVVSLMPDGTPNLAFGGGERVFDRVTGRTWSRCWRCPGIDSPWSALATVVKGMPLLSVFVPTATWISGSGAAVCSRSSRSAASARRWPTRQGRITIAGTDRLASPAGFAIDLAALQQRGQGRSDVRRGLAGTPLSRKRPEPRCERPSVRWAPSHPRLTRLLRTLLLAFSPEAGQVHGGHGQGSLLWSSGDHRRHASPRRSGGNTSSRRDRRPGGRRQDSRSRWQ